MNLGELRTIIRVIVPGATSSAIKASALNTLINMGAVYVNAIVRALKKNKKFAIAENQQDYDITTIADDYQSIDVDGIHWYNGSQYKRLDPFTKNSMNKEYEYWRDDAAGDVQRYFIDGDTLTLNPKPDTAASQGGWIYYTRKPVKATADDHYLFHKDGDQTKEISQYGFLDDFIVKYVEIWLDKTLNKDMKNNELVVLENDLLKAKNIINTRPDLLKVARMGGRIWH